MVQANLRAAAAPAERVAGKVYNVAMSEQTSLLEMYETLCKIIGFSGPPKFGPARIGDVQHSLADISRAAADFGYAPTVSFREGLKRTVSWYADVRQSLAAA